MFFQFTALTGGFFFYFFLNGQYLQSASQDQISEWSYMYKTMVMVRGEQDKLNIAVSFIEIPNELSEYL